MSTPTSSPCVCKCESTDSPLSIFGNAISIATFIYIVLVGTLYQFAVTKQSHNPVEELRQKAQLLRVQIDSLHVVAGSPWSRFHQETVNHLSEIDGRLSSVRISKEGSAKWLVLWRRMRTTKERAIIARALDVVQLQITVLTARVTSQGFPGA